MNFRKKSAGCFTSLFVFLLLAILPAQEYPAKDLTIGNRYYFQVREGSLRPRAEEVIADTLIGNETWYVIEGIEISHWGNILRQRYYQHSTDSTLLSFNGTSVNTEVNFNWQAGEKVRGEYWVTDNDTAIYLGDTVQRIRFGISDAYSGKFTTYHKLFGFTGYYGYLVGGTLTKTLLAAGIGGVTKGDPVYVADLYPRIISRPGQWIILGRSWSYFFKADYSRDLVYFTVDGPDWVVFEEQSYVRGVPPDTGLYRINLTVSDLWGNSSTQEINLQVVLELSAPQIISIPDSVAYVNHLYTYQIEHIHPNSQGVFIYSWMAPAPEWLFLDENGLISGTPKYSDIGEYILNFYVKYWDMYQGFSDPDSQEFSLTVLPDTSTIDTTSSDTTNNKVERLLLFQNFPNPFTGRTTISFALPRTAAVELTVFNILGETVDIPVAGILPQGIYYKEWQPDNLSRGIYYYRIRVDDRILVKKMILF